MKSKKAVSDTSLSERYKRNLNNKTRGIIRVAQGAN